ncbi:MAG: hypothetical protein AAB360_01330 [Patescibacteria group bacterium]
MGDDGADRQALAMELKDLPEIMAWPQVVTIGGFDHITRGKGKPENPLFKFFLDWITDICRVMLKQFQKELRV